MEEIILHTNDNYPLCLHIFNIDNPKAVVQVIHGMEEYQDRYLPLVQKLNDAGYSVVTTNMRGHGKTAQQLGYFADRCGDKLLLQDQLFIKNWIDKQYPNLPKYLFAHSMGTIIARIYLQTYSTHYQKVILSGYPHYTSLVHFAKILAKSIRLFRGPKYYSKFLERNTLGVYNKKIKNPQSPIDWLSRNTKSIQTYFQDKYCGHGFTVSAFIDLYNLLITMQNAKYTNINKDIKILLLAGKDDPCVGYDKGRKSSLKTLKKAFDHIEMIDYPDMRHELLNELDNKKVFDDILFFYNN